MVCAYRLKGHCYRQDFKIKQTQCKHSDTHRQTHKQTNLISTPTRTQYKGLFVKWPIIISFRFYHPLCVYDKMHDAYLN